MGDDRYHSDIEFLPPPNPHDIVALDAIRAQGNICPTANIDPEKESIFAVYDVSDELLEQYQSHFPYKVAVRWQIVTADLPIHYDWGTSSDKYLYLTDTGGDDVKTEFYSELDDDPIEGGSLDIEGRTLIKTIQEVPNSWFRINVKTPHRVVGITRPRIALIIRPTVLAFHERKGPLCP
ncbi:hypothetical protein N9157_02385 [Saprospiraceae bacterium]|nr:hypothetical protein [Saprospiraceae bacterium]